MRLANDFDVAAPLERTWRTLLDVPRVARALPGATMQPEAEAGAWPGKMRVRLGPVTTEYAGTARVQDIDEDDHVASYRVEGRETRGQGSAAATITTRLAARDGGTTRVVVETDMHITGRQAQLGHGLMQDVAGTILGQFAERLERELRGEGAAEENDPGEALDVGGAMRGALLERAALVLAGLVTGLALGRVVWRR